LSGARGETPAPYRPDIDGLRALSVAAVVLYHAELPGIGGGFVGVDVFFVISGYLITQWLMTRGASGPRALLGEFYLRRARRILPALLLVLAASAVVAWLLFLPADLIRFGKYLLGAVCMAGNFVARTDGGYFNSAIGFAPLLHLWSIAVEEQFYLLFPLLMLALRRFPARRQVTVLALLAAGSFAVCVAGSYIRPVANFYLGPTRAWELLLGALLAHGILDAVARRLAPALAAAGLMAILAAAILFDNEMHYPGLPTLLPALGTVALIVAGRARQTVTSRLLALPPLVVVGRASYSIYLWHLPPLVFATYYLVDGPHGWWRAAVVAGSLCMAFAAWIAFEEPLRRRRWLPRNRRFVTVMAVAFGLFGILGAIWWRSDGYPHKLPPAEQRILESWVLHRDAARCMNLSAADIAAGRLCRYGPESAARRALLWGDSHALALLPAYESLAAQHNVAVYFAGAPACRPVPGFIDATRPQPARGRCVGYNAAMQRAQSLIHPDVVILSAFWAYPAASVTPLRGGAPDVPLLDALRESTREMLKGTSRVCVVRDVPVLRHPVPYALIMTQRRGLSVDSLGTPDPKWVPRQQEVDEMLSRLADEHVTIVDPRPTLCPAGSCKVEADGEVYYSDDNHLSVKGSLFVATPLAGCLENLR
jgi:peptidoglycan/LPS O-acetylase OafA/YrhL